jgi:TfoX/Sxy family transcriptional regulator of competence genes
MAYSEALADRVRNHFKQHHIPFEEKKMMGGLAFMVNEKMCVGVLREDLMLRVGPENYAPALQRKGCREMDFTGKPMKGFVFVNSEGADSDEELASWLAMAMSFNKVAKKSKR